MSSSLTLAFSGTESILQVTPFPDITLDGEHEYSCAFLDLIIKNCKDSSGKDLLDKIIGLEMISVNCDLISNSYINGVHKDTIHQFTTRAAHVEGGTLFEVPEHLNYFPVKTEIYEQYRYLLLIRTEIQSN